MAITLLKHNGSNVDVKCSLCGDMYPVQKYFFDARKDTTYCKNCTKCTGSKAYNGKKRCSTCSIIKSTDGFYTKKDGSIDGFRSQCKMCYNSAAAKRWDGLYGFRTRGLERSRKNSLMAKYGLTINDFNKMCEDQGYKCDICSVKIKDLHNEVLHVDHDHTTGKIRGLLCQGCNIGLGSFKDKAELLSKAANYLLKERSDCRTVPLQDGN